MLCKRFDLLDPFAGKVVRITYKIWRELFVLVGSVCLQ
jgi:hypothetical protein